VIPRYKEFSRALSIRETVKKGRGGAVCFLKKSEDIPTRMKRHQPVLLQLVLAMGGTRFSENLPFTLEPTEGRVSPSTNT